MRTANHDVERIPPSVALREHNVNNVEAVDARNNAPMVSGDHPRAGTQGYNVVQGYVTSRPALPAVLLRPGVVLVEVLATNVVASSIYAHFAPNTFIILSIERMFSLVVNLVLAMGFLLVFAACHRIGKHAIPLQRAAQAGLAMALLTGSVMYVSIGNNALGPILLLLFVLGAFVHSIRKAYRQQTSPVLGSGGEVIHAPLLSNDPSRG
jgi:hypothetical protein